jgi:type II secretory pathway component PulF
MNMYMYKALNREGQVVEKLQVARDEHDLRTMLTNSELTLISATKKGFRFKKNCRKFAVDFLKHLRQLLFNKLDLLTSLEIVARLFSNSEECAVVEYIISSIKSGCSLSASLAKVDICFDKLTVKTVEISEKTSQLVDAFDGIIEYLEAQEDIRKSVKNAMRYPVILLCCITCVMLFWLVFVVPRFAELFANTNAQLPLITRIIIRASSLLSDHYECLTIVLAVAGFAMFHVSKNREIMERLTKFIPVIATIKREMFAMSFFYAMGVMIREKIHLIEGLECIASIGHSSKIHKIIALVKSGTTLSGALKQSDLFHDHELSIIMAGENSGDLWPAFKSGGDMLKSRLSNKTQKAVSMIQPITIIFIGGMLIIIICSVIMPMYSNLEFCT